MPDECRWTTLGVRMRQVRRRPGELNWLFFPGGPGLGSESLTELVETVDVPGTSWLVDLPGDGSNVGAPGAPRNPYSLWPQVLLEAVAAVPQPVCVGHAAGGEHLLSVSELEGYLRGLVLISAAPDAGWMPAFSTMTQDNPLPEAAAATDRYNRQPGDDTLRDLAVASAPWNFTAQGLAAGRDLLSRLPYNSAAVEWSSAHVDRTYVSAWWPENLPTLILSGQDDRTVTQDLWADPHYRADHVLHHQIPAAAHFPWIEQPDAVRAAFAEFTAALADPATPVGARN
ncbi:Alpha/beta hydrolase family protein (plasmid) [Variovorax sp. PBS-H4]|uniref:alpha/beta fold hydrolase n=1 Tax=Variovorax sp. PBS-H4 TaxID=434008 RepID=UPI0013197B7A|nr:alpha/beta hydrolase [Variovorax sp. PBS-H4]VTU41435.1 Alpha/beta hydrolase family protein [Variovorax sp. PBS-H4]